MESGDRFADTFREEASELLEDLEKTLLSLEENPDDTGLVAGAFRDLHTIKGSGAMFGFDEVASFTHELENVFAMVRDGKLPISKPLIDAGLESRDFIRSLLDSPEKVTPGVKERLLGIIRSLGAPQPEEAQKSQAGGALCGQRDKEEGAAPKTWRIRFTPGRELFREGVDPLGIFAELSRMGEMHTTVRTGGVPMLDELDPLDCHLAWDIVLTTRKSENEIADAFIFVPGNSRVEIEAIDDAGDAFADPNYMRLGELLVERGDIAEEDLSQTLASVKRIGDVLAERGLVTPEAVHAAAVEQKVVRDERKKRSEAAPAGEEAATVRVPADKLDTLVNLVGELVIAQARLMQITGRRRTDAEMRNILEQRKRDGMLNSISEEIARLTTELRDQTLNIRMLPIGTTFAKFKRLTRDLSAQLGKEIDFITSGAQTELDKTVIERLGDPLVHIIRNACDHGIEMPEERQAAGKSTRGTLELCAYHSGPNVFVEIKDDGAGLDPEAIRQKAIERELIAPDAKMSARDLFSLIFLPGFSTSRKVSNLSGRGVGMDVVKRSVDALRGSIEIESEHGRGTTIRIKLPLTLAIIEGLLVTVGKSSYVMPLTLVEECVALTAEEIARAHGRNLAYVRSELVPYLRLRDWFDLGGQRPPIEQIVIVNVDGFRYGLVVDHIVGQYQTVVKSLSRIYENVKGLSGATIMGDGCVALILDVQKLLDDFMTTSETTLAASGGGAG